MRRPSFCLAAVVGALVFAPGALAAGPSFVSQGGAGVASPDGRFHYVTVSDGSRATLLEKVAVPQGEVIYWIRLEGSWGLRSSDPEDSRDRGSRMTVARSCSRRRLGRRMRPRAGSSSSACPS
jgi:hypothetical protein